MALQTVNLWFTRSINYHQLANNKVNITETSKSLINVPQAVGILLTSYLHSTVQVKVSESSTSPGAHFAWEF